MTLAARFSEAVRKISAALQLVAGGIILFAAVGVTINAVARYGFGRDVALITEAGGFVFLFVIFLGLAGTFYAGGHVSVELLEALISRRAADWARARLIPWLSLAFTVVLMLTGAEMAQRYYETGRMTEGLVPMPFWIFMAVVPLGSLLLALALVARIVAPEGDGDANAGGDANP